MAMKKWVARILWWRGKNHKPRSNQRTSNRVIKAKSLEDLARKIARARKRSWELIETGGRQDPGGYFTKLLEKKVEELSKTEKELHIETILASLSIQDDGDKSRFLSQALAKLTSGELELLSTQIRLLDHD